MKKSLRYIVAAVLAITAITTQAQVQFCGYDINPGQTYTKSDFSQIKSGSFKLSSNGSLYKESRFVPTELPAPLDNCILNCLRGH